MCIFDFWLKMKLFAASAADLLPELFGNKCLTILQFRQPFKFSFAIHFPSLMDDFREDLEFRFSLGPTQLVRWFMQMRGGNGAGRSQLFGSYNVVRFFRLNYFEFIMKYANFF